MLLIESWQNVSEKRHVSENLLLFAFLYFTSNFDIIPYKSYPNNDMGCKSRPKLGCSQLTLDYATGQYLLTLVRISKSENQFQKNYRLRFFNPQFNFFLILQFNHHKVQIFAFAIAKLQISTVQQFNKKNLDGSIFGVLFVCCLFGCRNGQ